MRAHIVTCANRARYIDILDQMFRQRHDVFVDQMGWRSLASASGREVDEYDDDDAVYLIAIDTHRVVGSLRLLPSWRRSLMQDKFSEFVDGVVPSGPDIWEWTRWAPLCAGSSARLLVRTRAALIGAAIEFAVSRRARLFTAVCDPKYIGQLLELGWRPEPLGLPQRFAEGTAIALQWAVAMSDLPMLRSVLRLKGPAAVEAPVMTDEGPDLEAFAELAALGRPIAVLSAAAHLAPN